MATTLHSCIALALDVVPKLRTLTRDLSKTVTEPTARRFLRNLAVELLLIQEWLENLAEPPSVSKDDLVKLLRDLERMCIYPTTLRNSNAPSQFCPTLKALRIANVTSTKRTVSTAIRRLACDESEACLRRRQKLLGILRSFALYDASDKLQVVPDVNDAETDNDAQRNDAANFIAALYGAFASRLRCLGTASNEEVPFTSRIALSGLDKIRDFSLDFEVLFQAHPHADFTWQDACISVSKPPRVGFEEDIRHVRAEQPWKDSDLVQEYEICQLVNVEEQVKLALCVHHDQLRYVGVRKRDSTESILNLPSANLAAVLGRQGLTHRMRLLLSIILAKAVWQFYDSDWMIHDWNKEHIHFMYTCSNNAMGGLLYASKPYLSAQLADQRSSVSTRGRIHQFPKILALGIMLLEIELDITIESKRQPGHMRSDGSPNLNTDYTIAHTLYDNNQLWADRDTYDDHKTVIGDCIRGDKFEACVDSDEEREVLFENVVKPLQKLLNVLWPTLDEKSLGPMKIESKDRPNESIGHSTGILPPGVGHIANHELSALYEKTEHNDAHQQIPDLDRQPRSEWGTHSELAVAADKWFARVENVCHLLRKKRRLGGYKRVRVAVLDTGIHYNHPHRKKISGWRDFITDDNETGIDKTGHGTNSVDLIWRILPEADIYVARVFENDTADARTPALMAKAIYHAIGEDWDVDIITISAGFEHDSLSDDEQRNIRQAVLAANTNNVLIFAAASNYGNLDRITFPANIDGNVICIFSSSGLAKQSAAFNPAASETSRLNFCILGEKVRNVQMSAVDEIKRTSGTSIATSIAAAVAALVIDFSRQTDCKPCIPNSHKLKSFSGMCAIFKQMAVGGQDNGYDCVSPWKLLACSAASMHHWDDVKKREHICSRIYNTLLDT